MQPARFQIPAKLADLFKPEFGSVRYRAMFGGRGSGKSFAAAKMAVIHAYSRKMRVLITREFQNSVKESMFAELKAAIDSEPFLAEFYEVSTNIIRGRNGSEFLFAGLHNNISSIKSMSKIDLCICEEAESIPEVSWQALLPTVRNPQSEIWVIWNPRNENSPVDIRFRKNIDDDIIATEVNYRDNPFFPDVLENERKRDQRNLSEATYKHIWEGAYMPALEGAIYANEIIKLKAEKRLCNAPYDPLLRVHTVWDLGWNDSMSIAMVQRSGSGEIRVIDYIEDSHRTLDSYVVELKDKDYRYGTDFIPHDGRSRDFKSGKSTEELLQAFGRSVLVLGRDDIEEGIKVARMMFGRVWFDTKATQLLEQLSKYRRTLNKTTGTFGAPLHDESSHGADCFRYIAMAEQQMSNEDWNSGRLKYPSLNYK